MEQPSRIRRYRIGTMALAWLFGAGVVIQIFLAGLSLFENTEHWSDHQNFGHTIGLLLVPLVLLIALGRLPRPEIGMTVVLVILYVVQINLPNVSSGYVAAVHPLNAFILLGMPFQLGTRIRSTLAVAPSATAASAGGAEVADGTRAR